VFGLCLAFLGAHQRRTPPLNQQRSTNQQNTNQQNGNPRQNQNSQSPQSPGHAYRRAELLRERLFLERQTERIHARADALSQKWSLWQRERTLLDARKPLAIAQVAGSMFGLRLPPAARLWMYQSQRLDQQRQWLESHVLDLNAQLAALSQEIELINSEIGLLAFS
jgi:hypothetical protein